ncbi:MAG: 4-hydroxybenzoyl-CoA reductase, partial [Proteobacteria bacterium]|nr:4-hydroxybenzoyl-CoA reductase [Pseudomonadota bacterium]
MSRQFDVIGSRAPRKDAPNKSTGKAQYIEDITFPGELAGALLQSPHAHAKILDIDTSKALALPGVVAVLTAKDVPEVKYGVSPARYDENLFAMDRVRYVGDEIAAVAAVDLPTALKAVELIQVEYEPLPVLLTVEEATANDAPWIHEEYPDNICAQVEQEFGDVEAAFAQCDLIQEGSFFSKRQDGA